MSPTTPPSSAENRWNPTGTTDRTSRSVLHALRDRLDANVAAHLAAQMPILLKGVFYDGWDPNRSPQRTSMEGFLSRVEKEADLKGTSAAEDAVRAESNRPPLALVSSPELFGRPKAGGPVTPRGKWSMPSK